MPKLTIAQMISDWIVELEEDEIKVENRINSLENESVQRALVSELADIQMCLLRLSELGEKIESQTDLDTSSIQNYLDRLQNDEEFRKSESRKCALYQRAMIQSRQKLEILHKFSDGEFDRPFLNSRSVMFDDKTTEEQNEIRREELLL